MVIVDINNELHGLIDKAIRNDRQAQRVIYNRFAPRLLSICRQYLDDIHTAEDIMITAFMKVFANLTKFEQRGNFEAWLRRIAVNECLSYIRANNKIRFVEEDESMAHGYTTDMDLITADIQSMMDRLPYGCKMVFNLFAIEGYKHQEIAELLQINEGTSKSQMAYARKLLQQMLENDKILNHG